MSALTYTLAPLQTEGLPRNMCILAGFPMIPNKTPTMLSYPFGLRFANATTLYVADEGDGYAVRNAQVPRLQRVNEGPQVRGIEDPLLQSCSGLSGSMGI
jgi:hypothetical protein